jgi:hypothetical protein
MPAWRDAARPAAGVGGGSRHERHALQRRRRRPRGRHRDADRPAAPRRRFQRLRQFLQARPTCGTRVAAFSQFKEDARTFGARRFGYALQLGPDLRAVPYLEYPFRLRKGRLTGLMLAPVVDVPECGGRIGVEIVDPGDRIVAHVQAALAEVRIHAPLRVGFAPFEADGRPGWRLRVFLRESPSPARVFEFQALRGRWRLRGERGLQAALASLTGRRPHEARHLSSMRVEAG